MSNRMRAFTNYCTTCCNNEVPRFHLFIFTKQIVRRSKAREAGHIPTPCENMEHDVEQDESARELLHGLLN